MENSSKEILPDRVGPTNGDSLARPRSSWAQWISAISSFTAAIIAIWAVFFSPASRTLVDLLQSELALRNSQINGLEKTAEGLRTDVEARKSQLESLKQQIASANSEAKELVDKNLSLTAESNGLKTDIGNLKIDVQQYEQSLEKLKLRFVAGKLYAMMRGTIVSTKAFEISSISDVPLTKLNVWNDYVKFAQNGLQKLTDEERDIGKGVIEKFINQCKPIGDKTITFGPVPAPVAPYGQDGYLKLSPSAQSKLEKEYSAKQKLFENEIEKQTDRVLEIERQIGDCLQSIE